jgi:hypothetical protein
MKKALDKHVRKLLLKNKKGEAILLVRSIYGSDWDTAKEYVQTLIQGGERNGPQYPARGNPRTS